MTTLGVVRVPALYPYAVMAGYLSGHITRREYWVAVSVWFGVDIPSNVRKEWL